MHVSIIISAKMTSKSLVTKFDKNQNLYTCFYSSVAKQEHFQRLFKCHVTPVYFHINQLIHELYYVQI